MVEMKKQEETTTTKKTNGIVVVNPKPSKSITSKAIDLIEKFVVKFMYDSSKPYHYLSSNFSSVSDETPPCKDLPIIDHLPEIVFFNMVATTAVLAFLPVAALRPDQNAKESKLGNGSTNFSGLKSNFNSSSNLKVKANAQQAPPKINGNTTTTLPLGGVKIDNDMTLVPSTNFGNQISEWRMLLGAINTMFIAAEEQLMMSDSMPTQPDMLANRFDLGGVVEDALVFRQNFSIRSYEIGADGLASIETLMNHLQEVALSHCRGVGLLNDGFGSTPEMTKLNLIWAVTKMQVVIDRYPAWGDVVQVDSWVGATGKNGMSRDWIVSDIKSGEILARASSVWVVMNKETRKLSKMPDTVRGELQPIFVDNNAPVVEVDCRRLIKLNDDTADYIVKDVAPKWADLDVNQHVNNVKYVSWVVESTPPALLESHELSSMTLEYRKECGKNSILETLSAIPGCDGMNFLDSGNVECQHTLRLYNQAEVMRGRTQWRPKHRSNNCGNSTNFPTKGT